MLKIVRRGEMLSRFYGVAWIRYETREAVSFLIPFNILAAVLRSCWVWLKHGGRMVPGNPRDAYDQGRRDSETKRIDARMARLEPVRKTLFHAVAALSGFPDDALGFHGVDNDKKPTVRVMQRELEAALATLAEVRAGLAE